MDELAAVNLATREKLADSVTVAASWLQRTKGLLGRKALPKQEGLYIPNCGSIHTWFMRFAIDVVFVDKHGRVTRTVRELAPYRFALGPPGSAGTLELAAGTLAERRCEIDDEIALVKGIKRS